MKKTYRLGALNISLLIITSIIFVLSYDYIGLINKPTLILSLITISIIEAIIIYTYLSNKTKIYNSGMYTCFMLNVVFLYLINSANMEYNFVRNYIKGNNYTSYNVIVLKKNVVYNNISKLENKNIGTNLTNTKIDNEKINIKKYNNVEEMIKEIDEGKIQSILLSNNDIKELQKSNKNFYNRVRIIYTYRDII